MVHLQGTILSSVVTEAMKEMMVESHDRKKIGMATIRGEIALRTRETLVMEVSRQTTEEIVDVEADHRIEEKEGEVGHHTTIEEEIGGADRQTDEEALHRMAVGMIEIVTDHLVRMIIRKVCSVCPVVLVFLSKPVSFCLVSTNCEVHSQLFLC